MPPPYLYDECCRGDCPGWKEVLELYGLDPSEKNWWTWGMRTLRLYKPRHQRKPIAQERSKKNEAAQIPKNQEAASSMAPLRRNQKEVHEETFRVVREFECHHLPVASHYTTEHIYKANDGKWYKRTREVYQLR